jgi:hypothetical protein
MMFNERGSERYEREMKFAFPNKSRHGRDRALVILIGDMMQRLFGQKMSGTIVRLAAAATGCKITKETVKKRLPAREGDPRVRKTPKKAKDLPD